MKVRCETIDEFLTCLQGESTLFQQMVRVSKNSRPLDEDGVRYAVDMVATAVVEVGDEGQYLLYMTESCGTDYHDHSKECPGSNRFDHRREKIVSLCREKQWSVMPGVFEE